MSLENIEAQRGSLRLSGCDCGLVGLSGAHWCSSRDQWRSVVGHCGLLGHSRGSVGVITDQWGSVELSGAQWGVISIQ